ncbi:hypothetical protein VTK26DRAFT_995 [Humicola hyalothermophila]
MKLPFHDLKEKLRQSEHVHDAKVHLIHQKHKIGKFANLFNPQHRHDEEHEKACDEKRSRIAESHRFQSYFPERDGNMVKWYVDGRDYFWAVSVALEQAQETIYIADWWLSPELFLRRPPSFNQEWRLDQVLKRRAEAGVKIYVIVYREVQAALTCNSAHTKHALQELCPEGSPGHGNIKVMRHPDHNVLENAADMTFYWAHHEKLVVIDYEMAFIGGLDLCFGRWDNHQHALSDMHPEAVANEVWPGQDFNNSRVMDFQNVQDWKENELSKADSGRMPWHDVSMGLIGPCVYDIAEHFVQRWNFIKRDKYKRDPRYEWLELRGRLGEDEDLVGVQRPTHPVGGYALHPLSPLESKNLSDRGSVRAQLVRSADDWSSGVLTDHSIQNAYADLIRSAQHYVYIENQFFITATGDHQQQLPIRNTVGRAIVDAVLRAARDRRKFRVIVLLPAVPGFAGDLREDGAIGTRAIMDYQYKSICRGEHSIFGQIEKEGVDPRQYLFFFNLRSYDRLNRTRQARRQEEESGVQYRDVQRAHAEEVMGEGIHQSVDDVQGGRDRRHMGRAREQEPQERSRGENGGSSRVGAVKGYLRRTKNLSLGGGGVGKGKQGGGGEPREDGNHSLKGASPDADIRLRYEAVRDGATSNHKEKGDTSFSSSSSSRDQADHRSAATVAHHAMAGSGSITTVPWEGDDAEDEVNHWIQEELYVHAKLLIVDDRVVVCGSSNLNDRSQLGYHDSELSIVLEDSRRVPSVMDGQLFDAGWHAATLRRHLWREHLGLLPPQAHDAEGDPNAQPPGDGSPNDDVSCEGSEPSWKLVEDPLSEELWELWTERATTNTLVFCQLFHADPDDHVKSFDDYNSFMPPKGVKPGHIFDRMIPPGEVREKLDRVKGHLVWMPLDFLKDAPMAEKGLQVNQWTESVYT